MRVLNVRLMCLLDPGDYVYPFRFELPDTLPSSLEVSHLDGRGSLRNIDAKIEFHAEVRLLSPDFLCPKAKTKLRVYAPIAPLVGPPIERHHRGSRCDVAICVARRVHMASDLVEASVRVHNRATAWAMDISVGVVMAVTVKKAPGEEDTVYLAMSEQAVGKIAPDDAMDRTVRVPVSQQDVHPQQPLQFTTSGILSKCNFFLEVTCVFEGDGKEVRLQVPITVVPSCVVPIAPPIDQPASAAEDDVDIPMAVLESELQYATPVR